MPRSGRAPREIGTPAIPRSATIVPMVAALAAVVPALLVRTVERVGDAARVEAPLFAPLFSAMTALIRGLGLAGVVLLSLACCVASLGAARSRDGDRASRRIAIEVYLAAACVAILGWLWLL